MSTEFETTLLKSKTLHVQQVLEGFEIIVGYESRNKYRIFDENMKPVAYAAEAKSGIMGAIMRGVFKHWRTFEMEIFNQSRELMYRAKFPFRWFFKTLMLENASGVQLGFLQQRFAIFYKKFDLFDTNGMLIGHIRSPFFSFWTFDVNFNHRKLGSIQKKWSGALSEIFTDKDNFIVNYDQPDLNLNARILLMATCLMVDIVYFENNQGVGSLLDLAD